MADNKKANKALPVKTIYIKDQVLTMRGSKVISRRPRKKGEGKDNSIMLKALWSN